MRSKPEWKRRGCQKVMGAGVGVLIVGECRETLRLAGKNVTSDRSKNKNIRL